MRLRLPINCIHACPKPSSGTLGPMLSGRKDPSSRTRKCLQCNSYPNLHISTCTLLMPESFASQPLIKLKQEPRASRVSRPPVSSVLAPQASIGPQPIIAQADTAMSMPTSASHSPYTQPQLPGRKGASLLDTVLGPRGLKRRRRELVVHPSLWRHS